METNNLPSQSIFGIFYKGNLLTPNIVKKLFPNYGKTGNCLQGWRPPKKLYDTIGRARAAATFLPDIIKQDAEIIEFKNLSVVFL